MMNNLLIVSLFFLINVTVFERDSVKNDDSSRIILNTYLPEQVEKLSPVVHAHIENKLNQITSRNGVGGSSINPRFIITANVNVLSKDITPTAPPQHAYTLEVTFYIGDGIDGNLFTNHSTVVKGVGRSETKAYLSALSNIQVNDNSLIDFVNKGKEKITQYYTARCGMILKEAKSLTDQKRYEEAVYQLMGIPKAVASCYNKAIAAAVHIYKSKMENECQANISRSKGALASGKWDTAISLVSGYTSDMDCYPEAAAIINGVEEAKCAHSLAKAEAAWAKRDAPSAAFHLGKIPANSSCNNEAQALADEIGTTLDKKEKRDWEREYDQSTQDEAEEKPQMQHPETLPPAEGEDNLQVQLAAVKEMAVGYSKSLNQNDIYDVKDWYF